MKESAFAMAPQTGPAKIHCCIFQPAKSSMQSGRAKTKAWVLEYEIETARRPEPLMGWTASADTLNQVRLRFLSRDEAVAFAEREGFDYTIETTSPHRVQPRTYADNFRYSPPKPS
jgi:hypothetical protein